MKRSTVALAICIAMGGGALAQETDYTATPGSILKITQPSTSVSGCTSNLQSCINAGGDVFIPPGIYSVTGLTCPSSGALSLHGVPGQTVLHLTAAAAAIDCAGFTGPIRISDLTITGTAATYTGYGSGPAADGGQRGIHLSGAQDVRVSNVVINNVNGNGVDYENGGSFGAALVSAAFDRITGSSNYRLIYTHNSGEYATFSNVQARGNTIGAEVASGNINFANSDFVFNSIGVKISGSATNANPCHGTFIGGSSNHNTYNLVVASCGIGETFEGMNFIADQSGSLTAGQYEIYVYNSRGVAFFGGQMGSNLATVAIDPATGDSLMAGIVTMQGMMIREDMAKFACPSSGYADSLVMKNNIKFGGLSSCNN